MFSEGQITFGIIFFIVFSILVAFAYKKDSNIDIQIRKISVDELKDAAKNNSLKEIFGTGTAAVVSKVIGFDHLGEYFDLPDIENKYADQLKEKLISIQTNTVVDLHKWTVCIDD